MGDILRRGRLKVERPPEVAGYSSSIVDDERLFHADILVDLAHVVMLTEEGIIASTHGARILQALKKVEDEGFQGLKPGPHLEDVHVAIESRLIALLSEDVGGRIHTGRSRNDEVVTCIRLRLREDLIEVMERLLRLLGTCVKRAEENVDTVMPGYTHTQHAQPVTFAHWLLAHFDALSRDLERLQQAFTRVNLSPLGAAALATTGFPINRHRTAELLGFDGLLENSMDAVGSRDFAAETLAALSILSCNLSRVAEELILWSTSEFGMVELNDAYASTSSIMPQKKNPDIMELTRAKTGRVQGDLLAVLTMLKGLPLTYNRDFQEVTPRLWDAVDSVKATLQVINGTLETLTLRKDVMLRRVTETFATATELADTVVRETGLPFRTAHMVVGALVKKALQEGVKPSQVTSGYLDVVSMEVLGKPLNLGEVKVRAALDPVNCVEARKVTGGPNQREVKRMLKERSLRLQKWGNVLTERKKGVSTARSLLDERVDTVVKGL